MFFVLSKILSFFTHPFSWVLLLLIFGLITKREKRKKWSFRIAVFSLLFFTNTVIFSEFARLWEEDGTKISEVQHHDIAVVLGGMAEFDNNLGRLSLRRGSDRIWQALHLYYLGKVDKIMVVGSNGYLLDDKLNEGRQFKEVLLDFQIPKEDIIIETESKNTYQNALETKRILTERGGTESILLVTSAIHMRRAKACFEKVGFDQLTLFTTDHYTGPIRGYSFDQFIIPNGSNLDDWSKLTHEWVGYLMYWMSGYI